MTFRAGDVVRHKPSGEEWVVAWCDGDDLAWCGWPNGVARTSDCDLIRAASDEQHMKVCRDVANCGDSRANKVKNLYHHITSE